MKLGMRAAVLPVLLVLLAAGCATTGDKEPEKPESKVDRLSELRAELTKDPSNAALHYEYGNLLFDMGNYADAAQAYQACIENDANHARAYLNLGISLELLGNRKAAIGAFETSLEKEPDSKLALERLMTAADAEGDIERVLWAAERLATVQPDNVDATAAYAALLLREGFHQEAAEVYTRVVEMDPSVPGDFYNLGLCYYNLARYDECESAWKKSIEIMPEFPEANRGLAVLYWEQHDYDKAWEQVRACMQRGVPVETDFLKALQTDAPEGASAP
ncbi:MAG: tetratricopeptide repeat protein [Candidatus Hydrogenedens sp.]|nr:tetratricopeptide repeat protein [Candidatus Hydrogenedens sp.]